MSTQRSLAVIAAAALCWTAVTVYTQARKKRRLLDRLPTSLSTWRVPPNESDEYEIWRDLEATLQDAGLVPWRASRIGVQRLPDGDDVRPNGYVYVTPMRGLAVHTVGSIPDLRHFWTTNASSHVVRDVQGHDAIIRVVAVGQEGREQLRIWRKLATAPHALVSANHALPLLRELDLGHITFGVLPRVAQPVAGMYGGWAKNSVGDILDAVLQALEGLAYIHSLGIAHRDAFTYNFLLSWHPESLLAGAAAISKPRVYLIDFEVAVEFAAGVAPADRLCVGPPCIGSLSDPASYAAPRIPEMEHGAPYDPFKLDVWQLGTSLSNFDSTLPRVQDVLRSMASLDPAERLTADGALSLLRGALEDVPPRALHIAPVVHHGPGYVSSAELRAACVALPEAACVARPDDGVEVPDDGVEVPDGGVEVRTS